MNEQEMRALFLLAGIEVLAADRLENDYWPLYPEFDDVRRASPWWLVQTPFGFIKLGWRKRVIAIDWSRTAIRGEVTRDEVTKSETNVHAWSYASAVAYLTKLRHLAERATASALQTA